jgi:hypothetical protein
MWLSPGGIVSPCVDERLDDLLVNGADRYLKQDDLLNLQVTVVAPLASIQIHIKSKARLVPETGFIHEDLR